MTTRIDGATGVDLIKDDTVTELDIKDGAVTNDKIAMGIDAAKLTGTLPSDVAPGGLPGFLSLDGYDTTTAQTGTFVPSGDFVIVTGCGAGGVGGNYSSGSTNRGGGGGSAAGVFQAKVYVTKGATYDVSVGTDYTISVTTNNKGVETASPTTISITENSVTTTILSLGQGLNGGGASGISGGTGGEVIATVGTTTGTIDASAIQIAGTSGNAGGSNTSFGQHWGASGIFGNVSIFQSGSNISAGNYTGNQRGRGDSGDHTTAAHTGKGGFITILY